MILKNSSQKKLLFSQQVESPHHNLITHPVVSITKESNYQANSSFIFPPTLSKNTPPRKIYKFNKLQTPQQKSCGSSVKVVLLYLLSTVQITALTLRVIWKNPPVTLYEICKIFSKISRTRLINGYFHIAAKFTRSSCYNMLQKVWMSFTGIFA